MSGRLFPVRRRQIKQQHCQSTHQLNFTSQRLQLSVPFNHNHHCSTTHVGLRRLEPSRHHRSISSPSIIAIIRGEKGDTIGSPSRLGPFSSSIRYRWVAAVAPQPGMSDSDTRPQFLDPSPATRFKVPSFTARCSDLISHRCPPATNHRDSCVW